MENIERKQSVDSVHKKREFFAIDSLRELVPIIFIAFFFAYLLGSRPSVETSAVAPQIFLEDLMETAILDKQKMLKTDEPTEEKIYLNISPSDSKLKKIPLIGSEGKKQPIQKIVPGEKEIDQPTPQFPKGNPREALPTLEVKKTVDEMSPPTEKYTTIESEIKDTAFLSSVPVEEVLFSERKPFLPIEVLKEKKIMSLDDIEIETAEMVVKSDWKSRSIPIEKEIEEEFLGDVPMEKEEGLTDLVHSFNYKSSDFKWSTNDYNYGVKRSAKFINSPDGKASYCKTNAGIVLKINDLSNINPSYGIFVEKSEDGEEYNSVGVINAENTKELFYFDAEYSFSGQHHYRFRSTNTVGEDLEFGKVSVIRKASILPVYFQVNVSGKCDLILDSKSTQTIDYELKEAWGSLNGDKGMKQLTVGENEISFDLKGDPGLYFLTISTGTQVLELLVEKPGLSPYLSFYDQGVSSKQNFGGANMNEMTLFSQKNNPINFDFYLKNGNTLIFNEGKYKSEIVKIKKAQLNALPETMQGGHSDEMLWFSVSSNISYLHQRVPIILEHNNEELAAQINIFASKDVIRPVSHFSTDVDSIQKSWKIPGIESCPNTELLVFNDWGNLIYKTDNVTDENIWNGQKNGTDLPEGMYYYLLGEYGGWVQLER